MKLIHKYNSNKNVGGGFFENNKIKKTHLKRNRDKV